jgi:hypothetical protein
MGGDYSLQTIFNDGNTYEAIGVYINNNPYPYYSNIDGDGFVAPFTTEGDYFKLLIHGLDANYEDNGLVVEHLLAEFKDGQLLQSPDWEYVDLSALGEVGGFYYTMESSDSDPMYGPNTAVYFNIDKLQVRVPCDPANNHQLSDNQVSIYPNPFTEYIQLNADTECDATIYDLAGKIVLTAQISLGNNIINTSSLPQGVYMLKQGLNTTKIVK